MFCPISLGHWRPVVQRQPTGVADVALTYDDGPTPQTTPAILRLLDGAGAKATFFLSGVRVDAHPGLVADLVAAGHAVYGHGWEHTHLSRAGVQAAVDAMRRVEERLAALRPTPSPYLLRLPYSAGYNEQSMHRAMAAFHPDVRFAWCSLTPNDFRLAEGCRDEDELRARCAEVARRMQQSPDLPGSIVLLHEAPFNMGGRLVPRIAPLLLGPILDALAARGLRAGLIRTTPPRILDRFLFTGRGGAQPV